MCLFDLRFFWENYSYFKAHDCRRTTAQVVSEWVNLGAKNYTTQTFSKPKIAKRICFLLVYLLWKSLWNHSKHNSILLPIVNAVVSWQFWLSSKDKRLRIVQLDLLMEFVKSNGLLECNLPWSLLKNSIFHYPLICFSGSNFILQRSYCDRYLLKYITQQCYFFFFYLSNSVFILRVFFLCIFHLAWHERIKRSPV